MGYIVTALGAALRDLSAPRILAVLAVPMLASIAIWTTLSVVFWDSWSAMLNALATGTAAGRWLDDVGAGWLVHALSVLGVLVLVAPAALVTALVINEIVAMPLIVSHVSRRRFPDLERRAGGSLIGSVLNTAIGVALFCLFWLVTLPLWLTGIGAIVLALLNSAYLNQRLFRYDALSEHASPDEYRRIVERAWRRLYGLGVILAVLYYVPLVNLLAPVFGGLAYTHLCLAELQRQRTLPAEGRVKQGRAG